MKPVTKGGQILSNRRKGAIDRLEAQLLSGIKPQKNLEAMYVLAKTNGLHGYLPLSESDKIRIQKEISILKSRI